MAVLKARISGAWVPVGGGPSGGGTDEVVISATEPPLAETELWYDTSAPSTPFGLTANPNNALGIVAIGSFPSGTIAVTPGTPVDLTNPLSVTLLAGRRYRVSVFFRATTTGAGSIILTDNGPTTYPGTGDLWSWAAGNYGSMYVFWLLQGDGAAHELRVRAAANGQALMSYYGDTGSAFYVEDIGPTGSPALPIPTTPPAWIPVTFENGWQNYPGGAFAPGRTARSGTRCTYEASSWGARSTRRSARCLSGSAPPSPFPLVQPSTSLSSATQRSAGSMCTAAAC